MALPEHELPNVTAATGAAPVLCSDDYIGLGCASLHAKLCKELAAFSFHDGYQERCRL